MVWRTTDFLCVWVLPSFINCASVSCWRDQAFCDVCVSGISYGCVWDPLSAVPLWCRYGLSLCVHITDVYIHSLSLCDTILDVWINSHSSHIRALSCWCRLVPLSKTLLSRVTVPKTPRSFHISLRLLTFSWFSILYMVCVFVYKCLSA